MYTDCPNSSFICLQQKMKHNTYFGIHIKTLVKIVSTDNHANRYFTLSQIFFFFFYKLQNQIYHTYPSYYSIKLILKIYNLKTLLY